MTTADASEAGPSAEPFMLYHADEVKFHLIPQED